MAKAYSYDFRKKVIARVESKEKIKDVSQRCGVSRKTIIDWKKLKKITGDLKPRIGNQNENRKIIRDIDVFKCFIEDNNDKSSIELAQLWHQRVSPATIKRLLKKLRYSYKKNFLPSQKGRWIEE